MKTKAHFSIKNLVFLFFTFLSIVTYSQNRSINFSDSISKDIYEKAKQTNKLIFVDAYATWCGPCKWLAKTVFTNDTVADFFNSNFINLSIDAEKEVNLEFAKKHEIRAYPTLLFLDADENIIHISVGAMPAKNLIELALKALNPYENFASLSNQFNSGKIDSSFINTYLTALKKLYRNYDDVANSYFKTIPTEELKLQPNKNMIYKFVSNTKSREYQFFENNLDLFSEFGSAKEIDAKIIRDYMSPVFPILYAENVDKTKYESFKNEILNLSTKYKDKIIAKLDMMYFDRIGDWEKYSELVIKTTNIDDSDAGYLNSIAWQFFEKEKDKKKLQLALGWAKKSVESEKSPANLDTYANLQFKLGNKTEAIKLEEEAISLGKEVGYPITDLETTLEGFKK